MRFLASAAGLIAVLGASPAWADVTVADLQIAARALSFLEQPLNGTVRLGITYIPGDEPSVLAADGLANLLGSGVKVGNLLFVPVRVPANEAATAPIDLFFLPEGLGDRARQFAVAAEKRKLPCVTLDIPQVEKGICMLGVESRPKVRIYVNRAASAASNSMFVTVFLMMVTEF